MSQRRFTDETSRTWMIGYDNPARGFYAYRDNNEPEVDPEAVCGRTCVECNENLPDSLCPKDAQEEFDVRIGEYPGVTLGELEVALGKHGCKLTFYTREMLCADAISEAHELSPLQKRMRVLFESVLAQDNTRTKGEG